MSIPDQYSPEVPFESSPVCAVAGLPGRAPEDRRRVIADTLSDVRKEGIGDQAEGDNDDPGFTSAGPVGVGNCPADWYRSQDSAQIYRTWTGGSGLWSEKDQGDGNR